MEDSIINEILEIFNNNIDNENKKEVLENPYDLHQPKAKWLREDFINGLKNGTLLIIEKKYVKKNNE
jgi:hypothetical protein